MVSFKLWTGVLALLSVGAANGKVCYPTRSTTLSTTAETTTSTSESSTATESSTIETTTSSVETSSSLTTESSSIGTTTASTTDSSSTETTTSSATDSSMASSTVNTDATTTATTSSAETSSTYITITSTTASETETETASTSTSTFFPAGLFPCRTDADCDLEGGVCDPMRCGCINLMCYLKTTTMATMTTSSLPQFACGSETQCVGASFCLDQGVNVCACINSLCVVTVLPLP